MSTQAHKRYSERQHCPEQRADFTKAFVDEIKLDSNIGHAEALWRSMLALIASGGNARPANWAPFVVAGEGELSLGANCHSSHRGCECGSSRSVNDTEQPRGAC